jgi:hypothetical protein
MITNRLNAKARAVIVMVTSEFTIRCFKPNSSGNRGLRFRLYPKSALDQRRTRAPLTTIHRQAAPEIEHSGL